MTIHMLTSTEIEGLLKQGEGPTVEFKVNTPSPDVIARLISGFANTSGGTLVVGVREPDQIIGTHIPRFDKFVKQAKERLQGKFDMQFYSIELNGKELGVVQVQQAKIPIAAPEGYFRRIGDREEPLTSNQLVMAMSAVPDHSAAIVSLSETISGQATEIRQLRESFENANSWKLKALYALLGAVATAVVKIALAAFGVAGS